MHIVKPEKMHRKKGRKRRRSRKNAKSLMLFRDA